MIEVVFSDSEKGATKCAQRFSSNSSAAIGIAIMHEDGRQPTQAEYDAALAKAQRKHEQALQNGKPLGGNPADAIGLSFVLDIGDTASPVTGGVRKALIMQMLTANLWDELEGVMDCANRYWEGCLSDLDQLIERAGAGEPVRIWYNDALYSLCGFYDTIYRLEGLGCPRSAVLGDLRLLRTKESHYYV